MTENLNPVRVSITGMDGSGKSSAYRAFVESVPADLTVVRISRFCSVIENGEERIVGRRVSEALDNVHEWADSTKSRGLITAANTAWVLNSWRRQERKLTERYKPDLVLGLRDPYIDPIAYASYYNEGVLGARSIEERTRLLHRIHGAPISEGTIFLDVDPDIAVERINKRLAEEAASPRTMERAKWVHLHENAADLTGIRAEYNTTLDHFAANHGVDVTVINTVDSSKEDVAQLVRTKLLEPFGY